MKRLLILWLLVFLAWNSNEFAQETVSLAPRAKDREVTGNYLHNQWTTEHGLPQNDVKVLQTRDGYLWLGTHGGLARFDGLRFTIFDTGNTPSLRSNRILTLSEDHAGTLWVGTQNGGLTSYSQGTFKTYTTRDGLPDDSVYDVLPDRQGTLWISTPKGLVRRSEDHFTIYTTRDGLPSDGTGYLQQGTDGSLWFISAGQLMRFHEGRFTGYREIKGFPDDWARQLTSMQVGDDGSLWLTTVYGMARFQNGTFTILGSTAARNPAALPGMFVLHIYRDRAGHLRLLTPNGLAHYDDGQIVLDVPLPELARMPLNLWTIKSITEDREGNLWIGMGGLGLHRFKPRQVIAYTAETGLSDQSFLTIADDGDGGLWLGNIEAYHSLYHFQNGKFTPYDINAQVRSLCRIHDGTLLIGTDRGLYQWQAGQITMDHPLSRVLQGGTVSAIYEDHERRLWVGAGGDEGQEGALYRLQNGVVSKFQTANGLVSNDVRFIMEDSHGSIWVGTTGGLSSFANDRFTNYTTEQGLSHNYVRDIYEDTLGTLWIGTYGGGLNRFKDGKFKVITTQNGLFDNIVSRILVDESNYFWMSCNRGVYRVSLKELNEFADGLLAAVTSIPYGVGDGMQSSETNGGSQPAGWKDRDGRLWFPTIKGVVMITPNRLNSLPPPINIEQVLIGRKPVDEQKLIEVRPGQGDLEIHYTGLSFTAPEKMHFRYKLEGYDGDWVEAGTRRVAYYTNIAPGTYTFRVTGANNDGVWSTQDATAQFKVIPPFWRTWWFIACVALMFCAISFLLYRRRIQQLERARRLQEEFSQQLIESQERERKRIAGELHDSLSQNLVVIRNRAWLSLQEPEDFKTGIEQMEEIADAAEQSLAEVREIAYNLRPFQIDRLGLTTALESLVAKADTPELRFTSQLDNIDKLLSPDLEINLYRIVQEGINNIIKHSAASESLIRITRGKNLIEVLIQDNGRGFDLNSVRSGPTANGGGFGLVGITERARILGSAPVIHSIPGQGTKIVIKITRVDENGEREVSK
jgi:signal transduction histidine kinase/ligand-binding sensor domain-containing protein